MKTLFVLVAILFAAVSSHANENPAPTNVGASNYTYQAVSASAQILARNTARAYLLIQNQGNASVIVKADSTISAANEGFILAPQSSYEPHPPLVDSFYVKALSGTQTILFIEGLK